MRFCCILVLLLMVGCPQRIVNSPRQPVAKLDGPSIGGIGQQLHFDASSSLDPDGVIRHYIFGIQGQFPRLITKNPIFSWRFDRTGDYLITVDVVDTDGNVGAASLVVTISGTSLGDVSTPQDDVDVVQTSDAEQPDVSIADTAEVVTGCVRISGQYTGSLVCEDGTVAEIPELRLETTSECKLLTPFGGETTISGTTVTYLDEDGPLLTFGVKRCVGDAIDVKAFTLQCETCRLNFKAE